MKTTIQELEEMTIVTLTGSLDTAASIEVDQTLKSITEGEGKDIVFECADLEYIASSGLRILLDVLKKNKAKGHKVILRNVNDDIKNVFNITGFINLFEFE
ncbi:MAG: STAS domain-containing protein [Muribaculaceae bacterium]|jgi:anti-sigma B factor antagonist|nr:STAS domain-containing protein [Muribaculaceae bacterium]